MTTDIIGLIASEAASQGVDFRTALAVARQESALNPNAVSKTGAVGVFQLEPDTAAELGVDPWDIQQNVHGGIAYLAQQIQRFGDLAEALAAYNWGPDRVARALANYGADWLRHAPSETQNYVRKITAALGSGIISLPSAASGSLLSELASIFSGSPVEPPTGGPGGAEVASGDGSPPPSSGGLAWLAVLAGATIFVAVAT